MNRLLLAMIGAGFVVAVVAVALDSKVLGWIAIPVLAVALAARMIARRRRDAEDGV